MAIAFLNWKNLIRIAGSILRRLKRGGIWQKTANRQPPAVALTVSTAFTAVLLQIVTAGAVFSFVPIWATIA